MNNKPKIFIGYSELSGKIWATTKYKVRKDGNIEITGEKVDVTDQIADIIDRYKLEFMKVVEDKNNN